MPKNNVVKGSDGRYRYRYTKGNGTSGELKQRKTEKLAAFRLRCDEADEASEISTKGLPDFTFHELFDKWLTEYQMVYCRKADTIACKEIYKRYIKNALEHIRISEIKRPLIYSLLTKYVNENYKPSTVRRIRSCISRPYNWAINTMGYDIVAPTTGLRIKAKNTSGRMKSERVWLITDEDYTRFIAEVERSKYCNYFKILRLTGLRPSEGVGLRFDDINGDKFAIRRSITIYGENDTKTTAGMRDLPITPELRTIIDNQRQKVSGDWLFPSVDGKPSYNAIELTFKRAKSHTGRWEKDGRKKKGNLILAPVNFALYDFRHTFATKAAKVLRPNQLAYIMGHKDITVTLKYYVGLDAEDQEQTVQKLANLF